MGVRCRTGHPLAALAGGIGVRHPRCAPWSSWPTAPAACLRATRGWRPGPIPSSFRRCRPSSPASWRIGSGLPAAHVTAAALADGRLLKVDVEEPKPRTRVHFAWRARDAGKALKWWVAKLEDEKVRERLLGGG